MFTQTDLSEILEQFQIEISDFIITSVNVGHIHNSYKILNKTASTKGYFLQKVNAAVFQDVEKLMTSIDLVTKHLAKKSERLSLTNFSTFQVIPTKEDKRFYQDSKNAFWRLYSLVPDTFSFQNLESPEIAFECGKIQGQFIHLMSDFQIEDVFTSIPYFHNLEKRWEAFELALKNDSKYRAKLIPKEIDFAFQKVEKLLEIHQLIEEGVVPKRITHNDTKCNNVLFNKHHKAVAVVDLDTVMPGSLLFDFGDAIRTGANTASEDEKNFQKVQLNIELFKRYTEGFLESTQSIRTHSEVAHLASAPQYMTFLIGLRFLTDFLNGDLYYKTTYDSHNLTRTKVQWKLLQELEKNENEMQQIVSNLL